MKDQKTAIRVHSPEQSECVQKMAFKAGWRWIDSTDKIFQHDYLSWIYFDREESSKFPTMTWGFPKPMDDYTILNFDTDGAAIREFFSKKKCPECQLHINETTDKFGYDLYCSYCGKQITGCEQKCEVKCPKCRYLAVKSKDRYWCITCEAYTDEKKVPFTVLAGDVDVPVGWDKNHVWFEMVKAGLLYLNPERIGQIFEYYATKKDVEELFFKFFPLQKIRNEDYLRELVLNSLTPKEIAELYMKHCVSDEPVKCGKDITFKRDDGLGVMNVTLSQGTWVGEVLIDMILRAKKNGVENNK